MSDLSSMMKALVDEYKADPRNKIFVSEEILVASASEETDKIIDSSQFREVISNYLSGDIDEEQESIYDGAVCACGSAARQCFGDDPEEDIDYEIDWLEQDDGSVIAEVRPN